MLRYLEFVWYAVLLKRASSLFVLFLKIAKFQP